MTKINSVQNNIISTSAYMDSVEKAKNDAKNGAVVQDSASLDQEGSLVKVDFDESSNKLEVDLSGYDELIDEAQVILEGLKQDLQNFKSTIDQNESLKKQYEQQYESYNQQISDLTSQLGAATDGGQLSQIAASITDLKNTRSRLQSEISNAQYAIDTAQNMMDMAQVNYDSAFQNYNDFVASRNATAESINSQINSLNQAWNTQAQTQNVSLPQGLYAQDTNFDFNVKLSASQQNDLSAFITHYQTPDNHQRYLNVSKETGVPPELIAALHWRESNGNFNTYMQNGDPLGKKVVHEPKNTPICNTWEESAKLALTNAYGTVDWNNINTWYNYAENYNGTGYKKRGLPSPYVWSGTDKYTAGKFVADHKFSATAVDKQLGVAVMVKSLLA